MTADLEYPERWLLGWVGILRGAPGGSEMPLVEVVRLPPSASKVHGRYLLDDHVVRLYPGECRAEALCTLLHELGHAFAPYERASHGPRWRETYAGLFRWLTGTEVDLETLPEILRARYATTDGRALRVSDQALAFVLDSELTAELARCGPRIGLAEFEHEALPGRHAQVLWCNIGGRERATFRVSEAIAA